MLPQTPHMKMGQVPTIGRLQAARASGWADASPDTWTNAGATWQTAAIAAYALEARRGAPHLRRELAMRVGDLTGCALPDGAISVNQESRRAIVTCAGVVFQYQARSLVLLRPCAHCGTGRFERLPLVTQADLGYALSEWQPYHTECAPTDSTEEMAW
jgi:hypothetical protein